MFLSYKYDNAAFANNAALTSITYKNFGVEAGSAGGRATGELNGTEITGVTEADWETKIKQNSHLWSSIATVMNSLGYDAELNKVGNSTGFAGHKGSEDNAVYDGIWHDSNASSKPDWIQQDLTADNTSFIDSAGGNKWFSTPEKTNESNPAADAKLEFNLTDTTNKTKSVYFKHNGIIWEWTQTLTENTEGNTVSISLSTHSTTVPNVFKGTKKVSDPTSSQAGSATDTAYTFKKWAAPTSGESAKDTGVTFTFKVTA